MKSFLTTTTLLLAATSIALAGKPAKKSITSYSSLWNNSPFTAKPPPPEKAPEITPLDDWRLGGVSPIEGGYMVTLFHKKNAGESQIIRPTGTTVKVKDEMKFLSPGASGSYKVDRVEYGKESWKDTVVYLSAGGRTGKVEFDEKLLVPKAAAPPPQERGRGGPPGQPNAQGQVPAVVTPGERAPRQRTVTPPPTPGR
jgi:hypothetical protein